MKLLYVTPKPFFPESSGGAQYSTLTLLRRLQARGWQVEVLCGTSFKRQWRYDLSHWRRPQLEVSDEELGFPCRRQVLFPELPKLKNFTKKFWNDWFTLRLKIFQPDLVLGDFSATDVMFKKAIAEGIPAVKFVRSLPFVGIPSIIPPELHIIGNSPYSAAVIEAVTGRSAKAILPFIEIEKYRVAGASGDKITFINPTPQKGVDVAIQIARRLPGHQFLFVLGRWSGIGQLAIEKFVAPARDLTNVEIWEHQDDMRRVYAQTRILLMPSQFIETFGRVIIEAQVNGIPVVAAKIGGIPYVLGQGGLLVEPVNDLSAYISQLNILLNDPVTYRKYSQQARENADRVEFDPAFQVDQFIDFITHQVLPDKSGI